MALCVAYSDVLGWTATSCYHMAQTILAPPGRSKYFILPSVDHLLHLPDVSPQLQVLAMGFSWAFCFCQKMVESCVRLAGFSADALLMDRHRAPAMSRDSICFGVYVDGVCAVGCNHSKVLAALEAVKVTLDAAGLRLSLTYQRKYSQVFSWITRLGFCRWKPLGSGGCDVVWSFAARLRHLTWDQVAKLIGPITWSCLLRRPALFLTNAGYRSARTFGPRSGRVWPAVARNSVGLRHYCRFSLAILPVLGRHGFTPRTPRVAHEEAVVLRVANAIPKRLPQQAAVLIDGDSLPKSLSALGAQC